MLCKSSTTEEKKIAWQTWDIYPEASPIITNLSKYPPVLTDGDLKVLEKFVVLMQEKGLHCKN